MKNERLPKAGAGEDDRGAGERKPAEEERETGELETGVRQKGHEDEQGWTPLPL